ncbi:MAG: ABC transporter ATP-binding protein [Candidatus Omnitrophica bacterium]|nr:ABC transporter ATP-binding protein [Candidatus Omnitrophota bacterium]
MLCIRGLSCGYYDRQILRDINLEVPLKEMVGIIGPNGSGKTTLLRAVSRLLKPKEGSIYLDNKDIWQMKYSELAKKIAVVTQGLPEESLTVEEFVLLGRIPYFEGLQFLETNHDFEVAEECMALTDVLRLKDRPIGQISGGERQLALIARALAQEPTLLLLDEPTTYLDIAHQVGILDLIKRLNRKMGLTVLMVLHDLNLASEYCDKLVLLSNGKVYKQGAPEEVLDYKTIEEVYKTVVVVEKNPVSSKPYVVLVSQEEKEKREK